MTLSMKLFYRWLLAAAILGLVSPGFAEGLNYTFASIDYTKYSVKIDGYAETFDGSGYAVDLSYALRPHVAIMAGYSASNAEVVSADSRLEADIDATLLGFMIHAAINDTSDFIVGAAFINGKAGVSVDGASKSSVDADGGFSVIGFRTMANEYLEINGFVRRHSIEDNSTISLSFGAAVYVSSSVSLDLAYLVDSDNASDLLTLGVTKYF